MINPKDGIVSIVWTAFVHKITTGSIVFHVVLTPSTMAIPRLENLMLGESEEKSFLGLSSYNTQFIAPFAMCIRSTAK